MRMQRPIPRLARLCLALAACAAPAANAQQEKPEEKFEKTDPYTRGAKAELARAGIESFGPFHWADDIETQDIVEILGSPQILWIETAHFKLGSTLPTFLGP